MVDKWKAAKEELNDSEEEEDDSEILDRKRKREIEEWKSRQIASGEAKDNANFQPLGGDWREKVKRKRERAEKSQKKDPEKQQKPDLTKLSANLPSEWQAYWDESTKKSLLWEYEYISNQLDTTHYLNLNCFLVSHFLQFLL